MSNSNYKQNNILNDDPDKDEQDTSPDLSVSMEISTGIGKMSFVDNYLSRNTNSHENKTTPIRVEDIPLVKYLHSNKSSFCVH